MIVDAASVDTTFGTGTGAVTVTVTVFGTLTVTAAAGVTVSATGHVTAAATTCVTADSYSCYYYCRFQDCCYYQYQGRDHYCCLSGLSLLFTVAETIGISATADDTAADTAPAPGADWDCC